MAFAKLEWRLPQVFLELLRERTLVAKTKSLCNLANALVGFNQGIGGCFDARLCQELLDVHAKEFDKASVQLSSGNLRQLGQLIDRDFTM